MRLRWRNFAGWTVAAAASVIAAWLFGLPELAVLAGVGWSALALSAGWLVLLRLPQVRLDVVPGACNRSDPALLELRFEAPAAGRLDPRAAGTAAARLFGRLGTAGDGIVAVGPLGPGRQTTVRVELPTPTRGMVSIGPLALHATDPLGWWWREHRLEASATLLVRPAIQQLDLLPSAGGRAPDRGRVSGAAGGGSDSEADLVGLRPYVRGDDLRRIHWRISARRNEPHVVQVEPPVRSRVLTVVLDQGPDSTADGFERAVEAAASVLVAGAAAGRSPRLVLSHPTEGVAPHPTASHGDSGAVDPGALADLLDTLATVARHPGEGSTDLDDIVLGDDTVVLCTAGRSGSPPAAERSHVVVSCDPADGPTPGGGGVHGARIVRWHGDTTLGAAWIASLATEAVP